MQILQRSHHNPAHTSSSTATTCTMFHGIECSVAITQRASHKKVILFCVHPTHKVYTACDFYEASCLPLHVNKVMWRGDEATTRASQHHNLSPRLRAPQVHSDSCARKVTVNAAGASSRIDCHSTRRCLLCTTSDIPLSTSPIRSHLHSSVRSWRFLSRCVCLLFFFTRPRRPRY